MQSVSRCASALLDDGAERALEPVEQERAGLLDRDRERGVQDVRRGQAEVEPATVLAERLGDRVDERRDVVVRLALELGDPRRRRRLRLGADPIDRVRGDRRRPAAHPASAASSTSSIRASLASSDQIRAMAGRE